MVMSELVAGVGEKRALYDSLAAGVNGVDRER